MLLRRILPVLVCVVAAVSCSAAEDKAEADIIAKEEVEATKLDGESNSPLKNFVARGKFMLLPEGDERKTEQVLGELRTANASYLVKPMYDESRKILSGLHGKEVTLMGKLRGEGKYFIVEDSSGGGAKPVEKRNKRKL